MGVVCSTILRTAVLAEQLEDAHYIFSATGMADALQLPVVSKPHGRMNSPTAPGKIRTHLLSSCILTMRRLTQ